MALKAAEVLPQEAVPAEPAIFDPLLELTDVEVIDSRLSMGSLALRSRLFMPADINDPIPSIELAGFGGINAAYGPLATAMASRGKPVFLYELPRHTLNPSHYFDLKLAGQATRTVMKEAMVVCGADRVDIDTHSMGAYIGANVASRYPDNVRSTVFMAPSSVADVTLLDLGSRLVKDLSKAIPSAVADIKVASTSESVKELSYYFSNLLLTLAEGFTIGAGNVSGRIRSLRDHGIKTAIIAFENDQLFHADELEFMRDQVDIFRHHPDPNTDHLQPLRDPVGIGSLLVKLHAELNA